MKLFNLGGAKRSRTDAAMSPTGTSGQPPKVDARHLCVAHPDLLGGAIAVRDLVVSTSYVRWDERVNMSAFRAARWRNHRQHDLLHKVAMERAMKVQEVILWALAKRIKWWQAAEIMRVRNRC